MSHVRSNSTFECKSLAMTEHEGVHDSERLDLYLFIKVGE